MAEKKKFLLRIDPELYESLERWAADELRSINGQLEYVLADALRKAGRGGHPPRSRAEGSSATPPPRASP